MDALLCPGAHVAAEFQLEKVYMLYRPNFKISASKCFVKLQSLVLGLIHKKALVLSPLLTQIPKISKMQSVLSQNTRNVTGFTVTLIPTEAVIINLSCVIIVIPFY